MTNKKTTTTAFIMLLLAVPTTMQVSYAQFGGQQQEEEAEEQEEQEEMSSLELQLQALQTLKKQSGLTADQENMILFLEQQIAAQQQLERELGSSGPSSSTTTPRDTGEEAARRGAAVMAIYHSYLNATEHIEQARVAVQNNDAQAVLGNLTLIENELESMNNSLDNVTAPVRSP